jgi:hypothetical protein
MFMYCIRHDSIISYVEARTLQEALQKVCSVNVLGYTRRPIPSLLSTIAE